MLKVKLFNVIINSICKGNVDMRTKGGNIMISIKKIDKYLKLHGGVN